MPLPESGGGDCLKGHYDRPDKIAENDKHWFRFKNVNCDLKFNTTLANIAGIISLTGRPFFERPHPDPSKRHFGIKQGEPAEL